MPVTLDQRLRYQPDPTRRGALRSTRRVDGRCRLIRELPKMMPTPRAWVEESLRDAGFPYVEIELSGDYRGFTNALRRRVALGLGYSKHPRPLSGRVASRILRVDPRDGRDLFVARKGRRP